MSAPFERTFRSLHADRWPRWEHALLAALGMLTVWLLWAFLGSVTVRVSSRSARVQAQDASFRVVAEVEGSVTEVLAKVGEPVHAGQVLFRLDDSAARLAHAAADAEREALIIRLSHVDDQLSEQESLLATLESSLRAGAREDAALLQGGRAVASQSDRDAAAASQLAGQGALSAQAESAALAAAKAASSDADALASAASRLERERTGALIAARGQLSALQGEQARLEGELMAAEARLQAQLEQLGRFSIVAPVDGELASLAELAPGARVSPGQELATVVVPSELVVLADVDPATALGRVQPGQVAQLRIDGFSRVAYGTLPAVVERVATEPRDGGLRVELRLEPGRPSAIPLRHGMSGVAEIEVEQVSPAELLLRASGRLVGERDP